MSQKHFVSIIIPVLNEEKVIAKCLTAIRNSIVNQVNYEIILVDNGCTDKTVEVAEKFGVRILESDPQSQRNVSAARNLAAEHSQGNILAFLDADCIVSEGWLTSALWHFDHSDVCGVGHKYTLPENSTWIAKAWDSLFKKKQAAGVVDWLPAGNFFILKTSFESIGGFDITLITSEDCDLCHRLRARGCKIFSDPKIRVTHLGSPQTCYQLYKKERWHGKGTFQVFFRDLHSVRNALPVFFALFYFLCICGIFLSAMILTFTQHPAALITLLFLLTVLLITPAIMSAKALFPIRAYKHLVGLTTVYLIYGIARAICFIEIIREKKYR